MRDQHEQRDPGAYVGRERDSSAVPGVDGPPDGGQEPGGTPGSASRGHEGRQVGGGTTPDGALRGRGVEVSYSPDGGADENASQSDPTALRDEEEPPAGR